MRFAFNQLGKEKTSFLLYGVTIVFSLCICQIFTCLLKHPDLQVLKSQEGLYYLNYMMSSIISLIVLVMSCFLLVYTSQYYIYSQSQKLGLMRSMGMTLKQLSIYLICQNTMMFLIFGGIGTLISFVFYPLIQKILLLFGFTITIQFLTLSSFIENMVLSITVYIIIVMFHIGYIYRNQLKKLMTYTQRRSHLFHINSYMYLGVYVFGFIMMLLSQHDVAGYLFYAAICTEASIGIMNKFIPQYIDKTFQEKKISQPYSMILYGQLKERVKKLSLFIGIIFLVSTLFVVFICMNNGNERELIRSILAYLSIYLFIIISMTYKNVQLIDPFIKSLSYVRKIGLSLKQERKIIFQELSIFYLLLMMPLFYIIYILFRYYMYQQISISLILFIITYFIGLLFLSFIIIYQISIKKEGNKTWK